MLKKFNIPISSILKTLNIENEQQKKKKYKY